MCACLVPPTMFTTEFHNGKEVRNVKITIKSINLLGNT